MLQMIDNFPSELAINKPLYRRSPLIGLHSRREGNVRLFELKRNNGIVNDDNGRDLFGLLDLLFLVRF